MASSTLKENDTLTRSENLLEFSDNSTPSDKFQKASDHPKLPLYCDGKRFMSIRLDRVISPTHELSFPKNGSVEIFARSLAFNDSGFAVTVPFRFILRRVGTCRGSSGFRSSTFASICFFLRSLTVIKDYEFHFIARKVYKPFPRYEHRRTTSS